MASKKRPLLAAFDAAIFSSFVGRSSKDSEAAARTTFALNGAMAYALAAPLAAGKSAIRAAHALEHLWYWTRLAQQLMDAHGDRFASVRGLNTFAWGDNHSASAHHAALELLRQEWEPVRRLTGLSLDDPPPFPRDTVRRACRMAASLWQGKPTRPPGLTDAIGAAMEQELAALPVPDGRPPTGAATDGPDPPDKFRWRGNVCERLSADRYALLAYLWDGGRLSRCVTFQDACDRVFGKPLEDASIRSMVCRLDTQLMKDSRPHGIHLGLGTRACHITCDWE
jgi:hypothetical protein